MIYILSNSSRLHILHIDFLLGSILGLEPFWFYWSNIWTFYNDSTIFFTMFIKINGFNFPNTFIISLKKYLYSGSCQYLYSGSWIPERGAEILLQQELLCSLTAPLGRNLSPLDFCLRDLKQP
jgi:hypothetical protein